MERIQSIQHYEASSLFTVVQLTALRYADAIASTPVGVSDELFAELRRHFEEDQIVELTSALAWENYRDRFDHALGFESEGFSDGTYCPLPVNADASDLVE